MHQPNFGKTPGQRPSEQVPADSGSSSDAYHLVKGCSVQPFIQLWVPGGRGCQHTRVGLLEMVDLMASFFLLLHL